MTGVPISLDTIVDYMDATVVYHWKTVFDGTHT